MPEFTISIEHNEARLTATRMFADAGAAPSRIDIYDASEVVLVSVILAKPCGTVSGGVLTLQQADTQGDLVLVGGAAYRADWISGTGSLVASGRVTDQGGDGPFILQGTAGTLLQAGGAAILVDTEIS